MSGPATPSRRLLLALAGALPLAAVPVVASAEPSGDDAELIAACNRFVALWPELEAVLDADPWAPDNGPLHDRYKAIHAGYWAFLDFIWHAKPPVTADGRLAIARAAVATAERKNDGLPSESPFAWLRLTAMVWCAGETEAVLLPDYWPPSSGVEVADDEEANTEEEPAAEADLQTSVREIRVDPERLIELIRKQQRLAAEAGRSFIFTDACHAWAVMVQEAVV